MREIILATLILAACIALLVFTTGCDTLDRARKKYDKARDGIAEAIATATAEYKEILGEGAPTQEDDPAIEEPEPSTYQQHLIFKTHCEIAGRDPVILHSPSLYEKIKPGSYRLTDPAGDRIARVYEVPPYQHEGGPKWPAARVGDRRSGYGDGMIYSIETVDGNKLEWDIPKGYTAIEYAGDGVTVTRKNWD
jgi:hypothetical protein